MQERFGFFLPWRGLAFEKGMKMHTMSHVKVRSLTTYHILLADFEKFPIELYALKL